MIVENYRVTNGIILYWLRENVIIELDDVFINIISKTV